MLVEGSKWSTRLAERWTIHSQPFSSSSTWAGFRRPPVSGKKFHEVSVGAPGTQWTIRLLPKSASQKDPSGATVMSAYA